MHKRTVTASSAAHQTTTSESRSQMQSAHAIRCAAAIVRSRHFISLTPDFSPSSISLNCSQTQNWAGRPEIETGTPRRWDSRSLSVVCNCDSNLTPIGLEPLGAAIADHPLTSDGSLDQPSKTPSCISLPSSECCACVLSREIEPAEPTFQASPNPSGEPQTSVWGWWLIVSGKS